MKLIFSKNQFLKNIFSKSRQAMITKIYSMVHHVSVKIVLKSSNDRVKDQKMAASQS